MPEEPRLCPKVADDVKKISRKPCRASLLQDSKIWFDPILAMGSELREFMHSPTAPHMVMPRAWFAACPGPVWAIAHDFDES